MTSEGGQEEKASNTGIRFRDRSTTGIGVRTGLGPYGIYLVGVEQFLIEQLNLLILRMPL